MMLFSPDNSERGKFIGGWAGDQLDKLGESISSGIYNGFIAIVDLVFEFIYWAASIGIVCCVIVYIASKDQKAVSFGIKLMLAYLISAMVMKNI